MRWPVASIVPRAVTAECYRAPSSPGLPPLGRAALSVAEPSERSNRSESGPRWLTWQPRRHVRLRGKGDYGGPLFLLLHLHRHRADGRYRIDADNRSGMRAYLRAHQNDDGGWGLHVEGAEPRLLDGPLLRRASFSRAWSPRIPASSARGQFLGSHGGPLGSRRGEVRARRARAVRLGRPAPRSRRALAASRVAPDPSLPLWLPQPMVYLPRPTSTAAARRCHPMSCWTPFAGSSTRGRRGRTSTWRRSARDQVAPIPTATCPRSQSLSRRVSTPARRQGAPRSYADCAGGRSPAFSRSLRA